MNKFMVFTLIIFCTLTRFLGSFNGSTWNDEEVVIYQNPEPLLYGYSSEQIHLKGRNIYDFGLAVPTYIKVNEESGFLTATLVENSVANHLEHIFTEIPNAPASRNPLKFDGFYGSITFEEHALYRITQKHHYNEFNQQITERLSTPHYFYSNKKNGVNIEFSLESAPLDMILNIEKNITGENIEDTIQAYHNHYVIRIHQANIFTENNPPIEDIMFAATLIGSEYQYWSGIPKGNNYLKHILLQLEEHPSMPIYLNVQTSNL